MGEEERILVGFGADGAMDNFLKSSE